MTTTDRIDPSEAWVKLEPPAPMNRDEAFAEANRCLMCFDAPCIRACPTAIDVPRFIKQIATDDIRGSARTILSANILGASCARVCPTEVLCEGACVLHDLHERPIEIGRLQGYATDPFVLSGIQLFERGAETGKRVAIVGGGPAGLSCAAELSQLGHHAVILDAGARPGGLNTLGIAEYKMQPDTAQAEIDWVLSLGAELRSGVRVGTDISMESLLEDFDAVFLATGLGPIAPLGIPGEDLAGVQDALAFIADLKTRPRAEMSLAGERVAVVGGGNTAVDATIQSARLGADKVYLVYRRGREQMPAYEHEIQKALADGAELVHWATPVAVTDDGGAVSALTCRRTVLGPIGDDGRARVEEVPDSEFDLPVTRVLRATGQAKYRSFFEDIPDLQIDGGGRVVVDGSFHTTNPLIWAGGDCVNGGKEVVNAVAHGKAAARDMDAALQAHQAGNGGS